MEILCIFDATKLHTGYLSEITIHRFLRKFSTLSMYSINPNRSSMLISNTQNQNFYKPFFKALPFSILATVSNALPVIFKLLHIRHPGMIIQAAFMPTK
jgi:hypothetical protein